MKMKFKVNSQQKNPLLLLLAAHQAGNRAVADNRAVAGNRGNRAVAAIGQSWAVAAIGQTGKRKSGRLTATAVSKKYPGQRRAFARSCRPALCRGRRLAAVVRQHPAVTPTGLGVVQGFVRFSKGLCKCHITAAAHKQPPSETVTTAPALSGC